MFSLQLTTRVHSLEGVISYLTALGEELRYTMAPMDRLVSRLAQRQEFEELELAQLCQKNIEKGNSFTDGFSGAVHQMAHSLGRDGAEALCSIADVMGTTDLQGQLATLELCKSRLEHQLAAARIRKESHAKLYTNAGLLSGTALAILLW